MGEVGFEHPLAIISVLIGVVTVGILLRVAQQLRARQAKHQGPAWTLAEPRLSGGNCPDHAVLVQPPSALPFPQSPASVPTASSAVATIPDTAGGKLSESSHVDLGLLPDAPRSSEVDVQVQTIPASLPLPVVVEVIRQDVHLPDAPAGLSEAEPEQHQPVFLPAAQPLGGSGHPPTSSPPQPTQPEPALIPDAVLPTTQDDAPERVLEAGYGSRETQPNPGPGTPPPPPPPPPIQR